MSKDMLQAGMCFKNYSRYSSVTTMLADLNLPTLQDRRNRTKLQMLYKIVHHLVTIPDDCLTPVPSSQQSGYFNQIQMWTASNSPFPIIDQILESTP